MLGPGTVETPARRARGRVVRRYEEVGYGYLETEDGRELFFDRAEFAGDFSRLTPGASVRFEERLCEAGPRAALVTLEE